MGIETYTVVQVHKFPFPMLSIEPLIGGLKCSFAFLERGAVEELFTGVESEELC